MGELVKGVDLSQIAGTPEWKQRVQAEAAGRLRQAISGSGPKSPSIDARAAQVSSCQESGAVQSEKTGDKQEQTGNTTG